MARFNWHSLDIHMITTKQFCDFFSFILNEGSIFCSQVFFFWVDAPFLKNIFFISMFFFSLFSMFFPNECLVFYISSFSIF